MLKILRNLKKKEWLLILAAVCFIFIAVWAELTMPDYMSEITMLVQTAGSEMSEILVAGAKMLMYALISLAATVCTSICSAKLATGLGYFTATGTRAGYSCTCLCKRRVRHPPVPF